MIVRLAPAAILGITFMFVGWIKARRGDERLRFFGCLPQEYHSGAGQ